MTATVASVPSVRPAVRPTVRPAVYRRRRMVALALVAVVVGAGPAAARVASVLGGVPASTPEHRPAATYVVRPGDTLWAVARRLQPEGDVRPLVAELQRANGGPELRVGQVLVLP